MMPGEEFQLSPENPVLVIGSAGIDLVGRLRGELHTGTSNPSQIRSSFGGVARNVAENLARLGQPARLISAVGVDSSGDQLLTQLKEAGVDTSAVIRTADTPTGVYLAVVNTKGERQFALDDMRAISALTPQYLKNNRTLFDEASIVFIDANLSKEAIRTVISLARGAGIPICADPTSSTLAEKLKPYLDKIAVITPNTSEAEVLCDISIESSKRKQSIAAAKYLVSHGVKIAVITLAQFGICYATSQSVGYIPAIRTEIVDPTGAGDALTAALIFGLLNDFPLDEAMRLGVSAATLTLRYPGAVVPDLSLEKLYDQLVI